MKRILIIALPLLILSSAAAQTFDFGATAGVNFSNVTGKDLTSGENYKDIDSRTGFHFGLVSEIPLGGNFFLAPELLYSSQGAKDEEKELKLDYLQLPVLGKYYFTEGLNAEIGLQLGRLLNSSGEVNDGKILADNFEKMDISFAFGLGYKMTNGFFFRGRYLPGTNVAKSRKSLYTG